MRRAVLSPCPNGRPKKIPVPRLGRYGNTERVSDSGLPVIIPLAQRNGRIEVFLLIGTRFAPESNPYVVFAEFADKPLVLFAASALFLVRAAIHRPSHVMKEVVIGNFDKEFFEARNEFSFCRSGSGFYKRVRAGKKQSS